MNFQCSKSKKRKTRIVKKFVQLNGKKYRKNKNWSIGIEDPSGDGNYQKIISAIISITNRAIATSGNYRNIVDLDGEILGHTINPQTGFPIQTDVLSVSVLSNSCMESDAWATALMAMDYQTGFSKAKSQSNIDVVWILIDSNDGKRYFSKSGDINIKQMIYPLIQTQTLYLNYHIYLYHHCIWNTLHLDSVHRKNQTKASC